MGKITGFLDFKREDLGQRNYKERIKDYKTFYKPLNKDKREIQASRCMNCGVPFCQVAINIKGHSVGCPLGNLIPEWNDLLSKGFWAEAYERLSKTSPFSEFTGSVCPAPCENSCVCGANGLPITIRDNELSLISWAFESGYLKPKTNIKRNGKNIAVIGSGPAGLAVANRLNHLGYEVSIFERSDRIGGLLMYGIPDMKLDKALIERRVTLMEKEGVRFYPNTNIATKQKADELLKSFNAVILATGASKPLDLEIPGRNLNGIMFAVDFLTQNTKSLLDTKKPLEVAKNKDVLVIGSGDTSVDCIAVALRQGAKSITRFERSAKKPLEREGDNLWPEYPNILTTDYGIKEAIECLGYDPRMYQKLTKNFVGDSANKNVKGLEAVDLKWEVQNGKKVRSEVPNSLKFYKADLVLLAMGFAGSEENTADIFKVKLDNKNNIATNNYQTSNPKIFACGDARMGQSLVVWAIKEALNCANALDLHFKKQNLRAI
ncbi:glutamate synthase [Helicobacter sp. 16-1353]|uniref:glutamate synthase subunit beta n=1 Tax=Helicobacter sp. 16-1353 TaxID=2004996 RepID=UPI000DCD5524|nr:glutamate synthase subunit beta [Helicobacter sp. 16-1353]RAX51570.1 glutamate synthase [Helicobacter sp. 16-1353]